MKRLDSLQGLRAIAFIAIFLGHCGIGELSGMGVSLFLVLSGFLMIYNYYPKKEMPVSSMQNIKFAISKIKKLYLLHVVMLLPMLFLTVYGKLKAEQGIQEILTQVLPALLANISLVQAWFPVRTVYFGFNGVSWYLSVSLFLYFLFPYVLKSMKKSWSRKKAFISIVFVFFIQILLGELAGSKLGEVYIDNTAWFAYIFPIFRSGDFFIGCNAGYLFLNKCSEGAKKSAVINEVIAIAIMMSALWVRKLPNISEGLVYSVIYIPGAVACIYALALEKGFLAEVLKCKIFITLGNISAYTFLIHQVVINYVEILGIRNPVTPFVAFGLTIGLAQGYLFFEKQRKTMLFQR